MFAQTQNELHNMKHMSILAVSLLALVACTPEKKQEADYSQYVNPMIGTDFTGNTYPGAQVPFGMVQLSPDNGLPGWDRISGYFYPDTTIAGFSHTHLSGTGAGDLYDISFMPVTRPYKEAPAPLGIYSTFSHNDEAASAGYYRVLLKDYNINVELTATERCGIQRYTFPEAEASVFLNLKKAMNWDFTLDSKIEVVDSTTIRGYRLSQGWSPLQHVYFETRFSKPFVACHMDTTSIVTKEKGWIGTAYVARFDFNTKKDEEILVTTGISGVSMEGAGKNLRAEAPKDDFDYYQAQASANWNRQLSKIEVKSRNTDDMVKFYTALYHSMIAPTIYSDVDGSYYGPDQQIHKADGWTNYSTFSLWDTYRLIAIRKNGRTGLYRRPWSMPTMIIASLRWLRRWVRKRSPTNSLNVHRIIIMCTIRQLPLCSLVMRKETLPLISAPMIIRKIFARAMVGNISGPCRKIWTV